MGWLILMTSDKESDRSKIENHKTERGYSIGARGTSYRWGEGGKCFTSPRIGKLELGLKGSYSFIIDIYIYGQGR